jgi:hypothetical protein
MGQIIGGRSRDRDTTRRERARRWRACCRGSCVLPSLGAPARRSVHLLGCRRPATLRRRKVTIGVIADKGGFRRALAMTLMTDFVAELI